MNRYLAITQQTCSWLLSHPILLTSLHGSIVGGELNAFTKAEFAAGPLRIAGTPNGRLVAAWNREYLSGTGHESWGMMALTGPSSLMSIPEIGVQVFERQVYIFSQRLQGLIVDSDFIHRTWPNGCQTCLAGRGSEARQFSVCYFEGSPGFAGLHARAVISIGPAHDFGDLQKGIEGQIGELGPLAATADSLIDMKRRPLLDSPGFQSLRSALAPVQPASPKFGNVTLAANYHPATEGPSSHQTSHWTYEDWLSRQTLSDAQRRVLDSDVLLRHPVRVIGPAGSGKTLLMQLLALRHLKRAQEVGSDLKALYIVHNLAMATAVADRFRVLGGEEFLTNPHCNLAITTLSEYGRKVTGLSESMVIDKDAHETKLFQLQQVRQSLRDALAAAPDKVSMSPLMSQVAANDDLFAVFSTLVVAEISNAIKGRGLTGDEQRYVSSETSFSRLHGVMNTSERSIVYDCFKRYHAAIFDEYEMLDSDDVALSLAGRLRTPLWQLRRKNEGFDLIFVDEAQLFNENERRVFPYLSNNKTAHIPIALALDDAQDLFAFSGAGLANLGITDVENENLPSNHRSTKEIVELAFYIIQQTTDLFSSDFPDFEIIEQGMVSSSHSLAEAPSIARCPQDQQSFGRFAVKQVQRLRASNVRQICVVCHAETYWQELYEQFRSSGLPLHIIQQRGEKISPDQPLVVLSRPAFVGGQEFDAVLSVGLEQSVVPPRIVDNVALASAVEQQVLREMYLVVTRARYRYLVLLNRSALPNSILEGAMSEKLLTYNG